MEPLSATASIIAVLQLSSTVVKYISGATGAPKERKRLRDGIRGCQSVLHELKDLKDDVDEGAAWSKTIQALEAPDAPLGRLSVTLRTIEGKLMPKGAFQKALANIKWPFDAEEVGKLLAAIECEKSLLSIALQVDCQKLVLEIRKRAEENARQLAELVQVFDKTSTRQHTEFIQLNTGVEAVRGLLDDRETMERLQAASDWLTTVDYGHNQSGFIRQRHHGTGQWLLDSEPFLTWVMSEGQTLFCQGIPGAGKTILTSIVIQKLATDYGDDKSVGLAYIYCRFKQQNEQTVENLVANLLRQLSRRRPETLITLFDKYNAIGIRPTFEEIYAALQVVTAQYSRVFVIVDALDECQDSDGSRERFLDKIFELQDYFRVNILATSRPIPVVVNLFQQRRSTSLEIRARDEDIEKYIEGHVSELSAIIRKTKPLQEEIKTAIPRAANGMFLLAYIYFNSLKDKLTANAVTSALRELQRQSQGSSEDRKLQVLQRAYQDVMERINNQQDGFRVLAKDVLAWLTCTKRPLTSLELQHALAVSIGRPELDPNNLYIVDDMISACAGLVTVEQESNIIQLIHHTTQEYLQETLGSWYEDAQLKITNVCAAYLSFDAFDEGTCGTDLEFEERLRTCPFYDYAAHNWGHHACRMSTLSNSVRTFIRAEEKVDASIQALLVKKEGTVISRSNYSQQFPRQTTCLHLAAYFGMEWLAGFLPSGNSPHSRDSYGQTPLTVAAQFGHTSFAEELIKRGAEFDVKDRYNRTPLLWAARNSHNAVAELLLKSGADVNAMDKDGTTPLHCAAWAGDVGMALLLLENGADPKSLSQGGATPLAVAVESSAHAVTELLLAKGAEVDCLCRVCAPAIRALYWRPSLRDGSGRVIVRKDPFFEFWWDWSRDIMSDNTVTRRLYPVYTGTPLLRAAEKGLVAAVRLLLEHGADSNIKNAADQGSLSLAAKGGHAEVVALLLEHNAELSSEPLMYAVQSGHEEIVKLLLEEEEKRDVKINYGPWPLFSAAEGGNGVVTRILLEHGTDPNLSEDEYGVTALWFAAQNGHSLVVRLLLEHGAEPNACWSRTRMTPLSQAVDLGHTAVVELLLANAATDADAKDSFGRTPLSRAASKGDSAIFRLLLARDDVDPNSKDNCGRTPHFYLAESGHEALLCLLLSDKRSGTDFTDRYHSTLLSIAARHGHQEVVRLLLSKNFEECDLEDAFGRTPLWWARRTGNGGIVQLLLEDAGKRGISLPADDPLIERQVVSKEGSLRCDVCRLWIAKQDDYWKCGICNCLGFNVCSDCFSVGAHCFEELHELASGAWSDQASEAETDLENGLGSGSED